MSLNHYLDAHFDRALQELLAFLRIPSVSARPEHAEDVRRCADFVAERLRGADVHWVEVLETAGHPVVYGERRSSRADAPTVLIYGHYDVQPVDPLNLWVSPPFEPWIAEDATLGRRVVARGASDDKGQVYCPIKAVEAHLSVHNDLPVHVKFLIEGEEEIGSPSLPAFFEQERERLAADWIALSDTAMVRPGQPTITYALRGLSYLQLNVRGPSRDVHSGVYGGAIANPLQVLCELVAALKGPDGRVAVPGFYDAVRDLDEAERARIALSAFDEAAWLAECGAPKLTGEPGFSTMERIGARPSLDLCGIWGGYTGEGAKTVLPSEAFAKLSARLVPDQQPADIAAKLRAHLEALVPDTVTLEVEVMKGGDPVLTDPNSDGVRAFSRALERAFGVPAVLARNGGSIPIAADLMRVLGAPCVFAGFGQDDDRIHSPNEKFELENFRKGIAAWAYFLEELADPPATD